MLLEQIALLSRDVPYGKLRHYDDQVSFADSDDDRDVPPDPQPKRKRFDIDEQVDEVEEQGKEKLGQEEETVQSRKKSGKKSGKRSHHNPVKCRVSGCNYFGSSLKRHLKIHIRRNELQEEDVDHAATIMTSGPRKRGKRVIDKANKTTKPGRTRKCCPLSGCQSVVQYMSTHLRRVHNFKPDSVDYKVHLRNAKPYGGLKDLELLQYTAISHDDTTQPAKSATVAKPPTPILAVPSTSKETDDEKSTTDEEGGYSVHDSTETDDSQSEKGSEESATEEEEWTERGADTPPTNTVKVDSYVAATNGSVVSSSTCHYLHVAPKVRTPDCSTSAK